MNHSKKQSGFALPIAILIVVILIVAGGVGYYFYKTSQEQIDEIADWNIYNNYTFGYKIKYPDNFFTTIPSLLSGNKNTSFEIVSQVGVAIQIGQNPERLSATDWIEQAPDEISFFIRKYKDTIETIDINKKECVRVFSVTQSQGLPMDQRVHTVIPFETRMVVISKVEKDKSYNLERIYQKMLPTFEFIEDETANWKVYRDEKLGFSIKVPKEMMHGYGSCKWVETEGDRSYRPLQAMVPVKIFEDIDNNTVYISSEYFYELTGETRNEYRSYFSGCDKIFNSLDLLKLEPLAQYQQYWKMIAAEVANDGELKEFIKKYYGLGCGFGEKESTKQEGVYDIRIDTGGVKDIEEAIEKGCLVNFGYVLKYYPRKNRVITWNLGQSATFYQGFPWTDENVWDKEMVESFKFE